MRRARAALRRLATWPARGLRALADTLDAASDVYP